MDTAATLVRYEWGPTFKIERGFPTNATSAAVAASELRRIQGAEETLSPSKVVEQAAPAEALLHGAFTWDDTEAGKKWRLEQARELIGGLRVITYAVMDEGRSDPAPVYASYSRDGGKRAYRPLAQSLRDEADRNAILRQAINDLEAFRRRYRSIRELAGVFAELDRIGGSNT